MKLRDFIHIYLGEHLMNNNQYPLGITQRQLSQTLSYLQLYTSPENKVSMDNLGILLQTSSRTARECVNLLRDKLHPIGSNGGGYWWCTSPDQMDDALRYARAHRDSHAHTVDKMEQSQELMIFEEEATEA